MKICRFAHQGAAHYGVIENETVTALAQPPFAGIAKGKLKVALDEVRLLPPVEPPNIIAIGTNYMGHIQETKAPTPERP